ncbi:extracellular solute-binding protein [Mycetocola zhadangensis]|uniref:Extracellular solute-binding protein n=1 Tax=Mycetocola zhadangensis TaxID=1164595 RepID=A0A3L7IXD0_9MICO|nr:extracellular solute-binding protein [Mycetocola zhadangensis]RLQ82833.1 extracellular solute-binding protein [Mycetocola zhadangensis]GGE98827.1 solute-binding protein [Mycetocola zhadangensis]
MKRKNIVGSAAVFAVACLTLSGCAGGASDSSSSTGGAPKPDVSCDVPAANLDNKAVDTSEATGEITFMTQGLKGTFDDFFTAQIAEFEAEHPGAKINWTDMGGDADFDTKMVTQAANCSMADVINVPSSTVLALSKANLLLDFDTKSPDLGETFVPTVWDSIDLGADGAHTALPWYWGPFITTYNKEVFERAGLDPNTPPATMDEYFEAAHTIADAKTGDYAIYGNTDWYLLNQWRNMGVEMMNSDTTEFTFGDDKQALKWITEMAALYEKGAIPKDSIIGDLDQSKAYNAGNLAFGTPNASFLRSVKENNAAVYDVTGVGSDTVPEGSNPLFSGQYISVSVTTENTPLAVAWAEHIASAEQELAWVNYGIETNTTVIFPVANEALDNLQAADTTSTDPMDQARTLAAEAATQAEAYPADFYVTGAVQKALVDNVNQAIVGQLEPQAALDAAESKMNTLLAKLLAD